jgi:hypothetical protein
MYERTATVSGLWFSHFQIPAGWQVVGHDPATDRVKLATSDPYAYPLERIEEVEQGERPAPLGKPELLRNYAPDWAKPLDTRRP